MYAEISAAIQSVKTVSELAKAANSIANHNELMAAVSEVNARLMDATAVALASQERQSELLNRVAQLEKELADLRERQRIAQRYQLHKFPPGSLAYRLNEEHETTEPAHFLCAKCVDDGGHTKLQPWGSRRLKCMTCETVIPTDFDPAVQTRRTSSNWKTV
jgi:hypothetical protein